MSTEADNGSRLHYGIVRSLIETGSCPSNEDLGRALGFGKDALVEMFRHLEAVHGIVLHPDRPEPWVIHPFSLTPTATWVQGETHGWWAPCVWCAFGIGALVGGDVQVHTRVAGETEPLVVGVRDGAPLPPHDGYFAHFAIRPAEAWNNVHAHCAMILPFRSQNDISRWTARHGLPLGEAVPLGQVATLARRWYGAHADPHWRKWTIHEAQQIFCEAGLRSAFWDLNGRQGRF